MKKIFLASLILLGFTSCIKDDTIVDFEGKKSVPMSFTVSEEAGARTTITDGQITWKDGDKFGVFVDNATTPTVNTEGTITIKNGVPTVSFEAEAFEAGDVISAYYPYNASVTSKTVAFDIPVVQYQTKADEYNGAYHPMIGVSKAFATTSGENVLFRPTATIAKFNFYSSNPEYVGEKVQKIIFRSNSIAPGQTNHITGKFKYDISTVTEEAAPDFSGKTTADGWVDNGDTWLAEIILDEELDVTAERQAAYLTMLPGNYAGHFFVVTDKAKYYFLYHVTPTYDDNGDILFGSEPTASAEDAVPFNRNTIKEIPIDLGNTGTMVHRVAYNPVTNFTSLRKAKTYGTTRGDQTIIKGVFVSDCDSKNMEYNPNTAYSTVDITETDKTGYFQELDGEQGFRVKFESAEYNTFKPGDVAVINLSGTSVVADENVSGTKSYTIEGLRKENIISLTAGEVPSKVKTIAELTDEDIYTYVTLSDMEFVFKEGAYTNVKESYVQYTALNEGTKGPKNMQDSSARLMQDKDGNAIYMQINSLCQWRRKVNALAAGNHGVPQGVGKLHGIVTTNADPRYGNNSGFIGKYSIRPIDESDIAGDNAIPWAAASARTTLAAWNFDHRTTGPEVHTPSTAGCPGTVYEWEGTFGTAQTSINKMKATEGDNTAVFYCDNTTRATGHPRGVVFYWNPSAGCRPQFTDGYESKYVWDGLGENVDGYWKAPEDSWSGTSAASRNVINHYCGCNDLGDYTWVTNLSGWWDWENEGVTTGFMARVSTLNVSKPLTISFSMGAGGKFCNDWNEYLGSKYNSKTADGVGFLSGTTGYYSQNFPLYWKVQYSTDGGTTWNDGAVEAATGETQFMLHPVAAYWESSDLFQDPTSTTATTTTGTRYCNQYTAGLVEHSFVLPAAASGQESVIIRITPASKRIATAQKSVKDFEESMDQSVDASSGVKFGNIIRFGGISIQY